MDGKSKTQAHRASATPRRATTGDLLTVEQAADYLNITDHFVRRLLQERRLPFVKVGRLVRLRQSALDEWLAEAEVPARRPTTRQRAKAS